MMKKFDRWAFCKGFQVIHEGKPYLDRLRVIQTPLGSIYLHRIHEPDFGRDPHDHPWWFASLVLSGGYTEEVWDNPREDFMTSCKVRKRPRFSLASLSRKQAHRITSVRGELWTLVLTGPRCSSWGFWNENGFIPWREYYSRVPTGYVRSEGDALWGGR